MRVILAALALPVATATGSDLGPPPEPVYLTNSRVMATWQWAQSAWAEIQRLEAELAEAQAAHPAEPATVAPWSGRMAFSWVEGYGHTFVYDVTVTGHPGSPGGQPEPEPIMPEPIVIEAEAFTSAVNLRGLEPLDKPEVFVSETGSGSVIGWNAAGESYAYSVGLPVAGIYALTLTMSNPASGGRVRVTVAGQSVEVGVPQTGAWDVFQETGPATFALPAGPVAITVENLADAPGSEWTGDFDKITLTATELR